MRFRPRSRPSGRNHSCGGVRAAAQSAGADGDGRNAQRERNVGVGGGAVQVRADAQVRVHRAHVVQDGRILRQRGGRPRADLLQPATVTLSAGGALVFQVAGALHRGSSAPSTSSSIFSLLSERISTLARAVCGDGVDARAAFDEAHVDGRLRRALQARLGKQRHRPAQRVQRIAHADNRSSYARPGR